MSDIKEKRVCIDCENEFNLNKLNFKFDVRFNRFIRLCRSCENDANYERKNKFSKEHKESIKGG